MLRPRRVSLRERSPQRTRYLLLRLLVEDEIGTLWQAEDGLAKRRVTVRIISQALSTDPTFAKEFRRDMSLAWMCLAHPNMAQIINYGEGEEGQPWFVVMEDVDGEPLANLLRRRGPLSVDQAARLVAEVARAVNAAHDISLVHGGVNSENVAVTQKGGVKVLDFGVAGAWVRAARGTAWNGELPLFVSPEQAAGREARPASDVYALGILLLELVSGRPHSALGPVVRSTSGQQDLAASLRDSVQKAPPSLLDAWQRALARNPDARPSALEFAAHLRGEARTSSRASRPSDDSRWGQETGSSTDPGGEGSWRKVRALPQPPGVRRGRRSETLALAGESAGRQGREFGSGAAGRAGPLAHHASRSVVLGHLLRRPGIPGGAGRRRVVRRTGASHGMLLLTGVSLVVAVLALVIGARAVLPDGEPSSTSAADPASVEANPKPADMNSLATRMAFPLSQRDEPSAEMVLSTFSASFPQCRFTWDAGWFSSTDEERAAWRGLAGEVTERNPDLILGHGSVEVQNGFEGPRGETVLGVATGALCGGSGDAEESLSGAPAAGRSWTHPRSAPVVPAGRGEPRPSRQLGDETFSSRDPRVRSLAVVGASDHDPLGDGAEYSERAPLAVDGDARTWWQTERYETAGFSSLKEGVGIWLDLGRSARVHGLTIVSPIPGWRFQLKVSRSPRGLVGGRLSGPLPDRQGTGEFSVPASGFVSVQLRPVEANRILLWIIRLGPDRGGYAAAVAEVRITGSR